ncbi:hypothetical protein [Labilibaculum manganireducens]|uniref:Secretion system C-terminal sorting domain-containing protein n=1 Tax=Labilibaculum manganireducens TaxID=1940525 RepID=A0A2N3HX53_9BACT|nr:hypothetical protein [Labilibaculum manganireducens]PKQ62660.1 hypothetical protein BZG01_16910 [Labilibaculum manganireducens]
MKTKNTFKGLVLGVILFLGTSSAFATGNIRINPYLDTDLSIVSIINPTESLLKMKIYDEAGNLYYSNKVGGETTAQKLFDFSYLEDGTYKIVLTGKGDNIEKEFVVANNKLVAELAENTAEKTLFRTEDNNLFVTYLSFENKAFNISINDEFGNEVFNGSYASEPTFSKKFNVEALPKGDYKVRLVSDKKEYNYAFRK